MSKDDKKNPWTTLSSKQIYQNPWIRVREDQVLRPDGNPGIYSVVETRYATGVVTLTPDNTTHLVGQYRYPLDVYSWEIIQGGAEVDEQPLVAAKRELKEESGLIAEKWQPLGKEVHLSNCHSDERAMVFLAQELSQTPAQPDGTEELEVIEVSIEKALRMVHEGEITDAMSIIGLLRFEKIMS